MLRLQQPGNRLGEYDMEYRLKFTVFSDDAGGQDTFAANLHGKRTYEAAISLYFQLLEALAEGLPAEDIGAAQRVLSALSIKPETFAADD
ncbi:hypothetical protein CPJ18_23455 [Agrobacterium rosae]|uniref:Uncharacterized protein n=2 Tax=Agrobacterium TaxID=357 RepID=A0AAE5VME5_9HYPH|nr:hypothetical protein DXM25_22390 [Agrobacterium rosae]POO48928.1 hypothetical protein CPJ18_23455 [Agrobacterium rosae]